MTAISTPTIDILKNFSSINKSIVIKPGNKISTLALNKNILAIAEVSEEFDSELAIYDLGVFIRGLALFSNPVIDTSQSNYVTVKDEIGSTKSRFFYADPDIITQPPEKEIELPSEDVKFDLTSSVFNKIINAAQWYMLTDVCIFGHDGEMQLQVVDKKNETSNSFAVSLGETDEEFCYCLKIENLNLAREIGKRSVDYSVTISKSGVARFDCLDMNLKYFIATEPNN